MKQVVLILVSAFIISQDDGKTYHREYIIGKIPGLAVFEKMNATEREFDNMLMKDKLSRFKLNRSRITLNKHVGKGSPETIPIPCSCTLSHDSLFISSTVGLFGGNGFNAMVKGKEFEATFVEYTEDDYVKTNLSDSFSREAHVKSKYQNMIFKERPTFQPGQQLSGLLTFTSNYYYSKGLSNTVDSNHVTVKMLFTCKTMPASLIR